MRNSNCRFANDGQRSAFPVSANRSLKAGSPLYWFVALCVQFLVLLIPGISIAGSDLYAAGGSFANGQTLYLSPVPEPSGLALAILAAAALGCMRLRAWRPALINPLQTSPHAARLISSLMILVGFNASAFAAINPLGTSTNATARIDPGSPDFEGTVDPSSNFFATDTHSATANVRKTQLVGVTPLMFPVGGEVTTSATLGATFNSASAWQIGVGHSFDNYLTGDSLYAPGLHLAPWGGSTQTSFSYDFTATPFADSQSRWVRMSYSGWNASFEPNFSSDLQVGMNGAAFPDIEWSQIAAAGSTLLPLQIESGSNQFTFDSTVTKSYSNDTVSTHSSFNAQFSFSIETGTPDVYVGEDATIVNSGFERDWLARSDSTLFHGAPITGWSTDVGSFAYRPPADELPGGTTQGRNLGVTIDLGFGGDYLGGIEQHIGQLEAGTYTITFDAISMTEFFPFFHGGYAVELLAGDAFFGPSTVIAAAIDSQPFVPGEVRSLSLVAVTGPDNPQLGQDLEIRLRSPGGILTYAAYDRVRMSFQPVPEPTTLLLTGVGALIALLARFRICGRA